jgi:hypothetical protein
MKEWLGGASGIWGRNKMHTGLWWVNLKKGDDLQHPGVDGSIILKLVMNTYYGKVWTVFIWLKKH